MGCPQPLGAPAAGPNDAAPGAPACGTTSFSPGSGGGMGGHASGMGGPMGFGSPMGMYGMGGMNCMGPMGPMGGMAMGGACMGGEAVFRMMLQGSVLGQAPSEMVLVLPNELLHQCLIPQGHLAEIARKCEIRIDLRGEDAATRQVALMGTIVANAMAAYFLQERAFQHMCNSAGAGSGNAGSGS